MTLRNTFDKVAVWQLHEDKIEQIFSFNIYLNLNKILIIMKLNKGFQTSILNKKYFYLVEHTSLSQVSQHCLVADTTPMYNYHN